MHHIFSPIFTIGLSTANSREYRTFSKYLLTALHVKAFQSHGFRLLTDRDCCIIFHGSLSNSVVWHVGHHTKCSVQGTMSREVHSIQTTKYCVGLIHKHKQRTDRGNSHRDTVTESRKRGTAAMEGKRPNRERGGWGWEVLITCSSPFFVFGKKKKLGGQKMGKNEKVTKSNRIADALSLHYSQFRFFKKIPGPNFLEGNNNEFH